MTTSYSRCVHEFLPGQCAICLGLDRRSSPGDPRVARTFTARYPGRCVVDYAHRIHADDHIGVTEDGAYLCAECTTEATAP